MENDINNSLQKLYGVNFNSLRYFTRIIEKQYFEKNRCNDFPLNAFNICKYYIFKHILGNN